MTTHQFKITEGCPKTGDKIKCNTTQSAGTFSTNQPSATDRAKEGMARHAAHRANEKAFKIAKEAEREASRKTAKTHRQSLRPDQLE